MTGRTITPIPLSITRDGDTVTVHGSAADITLLKILAIGPKRTALDRIQRIWDTDDGTARLLLRAAREGSEE